MDINNCYQKLCFMENIASQYVYGRNSADILRKMREDIFDKVYRVAFIGEFNRGKSSLINALLGSDVLPMDILPSTATVIRMIYGNERKIHLYYTDGSEAEIENPEKLQKVATKRDDISEQIAATIREIVIEYPSQLCRENIQILDTPGLNENTNMTEITKKVLKDIDAAVIVVSVELLLSQTERDLILDMIAEDGIRHLIFAVTFIDTLDGETEKDQMISFIAKQLRENTLEDAKRRFAGKDVLIEKAEKLLSSPSVFGVSALEARRAFQKGDRNLLERSRLPKFKENLLAFLTSSQTADLPIKTLKYLEWMIEELPKWHKEEKQILKESLRTKATDKRLNVFSESELKNNVDSALKIFDQLLTLSLGLTQKYVNIFCKTHILNSYLSHIGEVNATDHLDFKISNAMQKAEKEFLDEINQKRDVWEKTLRRYMNNVEIGFQDCRQAAKLDTKSLADKLLTFHEKNSLPMFSWKQDPTPPKGCDDHLSHIYAAINSSTDYFWENIKNCIENWKEELNTQLGEDTKKIRSRNSKDLNSKLEALPFLYKQQLGTLWAIQDELDPNAYKQRKTDIQDEYEEDIPQKITRIISELQGEYGSLPNIFFRNGTDRSRNKIMGAIKGYANDVKYDDVIFCYDDTFFGSSDNGFLMTCEKLCSMNYLESSKSIPLTDIETIDPAENKFNTLFINASSDKNIYINVSSYAGNKNTCDKLIELMFTVIGEFAI
ncbi:MAG: dynamin family protein [Selenomonadaceae bacterium]|nr:dynamin family protein [Selenomonadaceae bacterium]